MDLRQINFGIEIETVKRTRERVARAIHSVTSGQIRHVGSPASFDACFDGPYPTTTTTAAAP